MTLENILEKMEISKYRLAKESDVPYTTISDICSGRSQLEKCSAETIYRLSKALNISMEELIEPYLQKRGSFETFKSNVCHRLKELGDVEFVIEVLEKKYIEEYYEKKWYRESLYMLAMLDYISRENSIPLCTKYERLRKAKMEKPIFPASIIALAEATNDPDVKEEALKAAIPEFKRFNIIESEIRNVV